MQEDREGVGSEGMGSEFHQNPLHERVEFLNTLPSL